MTELEGFKFVTTLVLEFKKIESDNEKDIAPFIRTQRLKQLLTRVILMMFLNKYDVFQNQKVMMKQNIAPFIRHQRLKQLLMRVILMMYLNQSIVQLCQTYKNL